MKKSLFIIIMLALCVFSLNAREVSLTSPNGKISVNIRITDKVYYSIYQSNQELLTDCVLGLSVDNMQLGTNPKLVSQKISKISGEVRPIVPLKFSTVDNTYNLLALKFKDNYSIEFRAYDEGIAYRFVTNLRGDKQGKVKIMNEDVNINLPNSYLLHLQPAKDFTSNYETNYMHVASKEWKSSDEMSTLPILIDTKTGGIILFSETSLIDYPCLFLKSNYANGMIPAFSGVALE